MSNMGLAKRILIEIAELFDPLQEAIADPENFSAFMRDLGWEISGGVPPVFQQMETFFQSLEDTIDLQEVSKERFDRIVTALYSLITTIEDIPNTTRDLLDDSSMAATFAAEFAHQLLERLSTAYLVGAAPEVGGVLAMLGLVEDEVVDGVGELPRGIDWSAIPRIIDEPIEFLRSYYKWGRSDFREQKFLKLVALLAAALGARPYSVTDERSEPNARTQLHRLLRVPLTLRSLSDLDEKGIGFKGVPAQDDLLPGFAVLLYSIGNIDAETDLGTRMVLQVISSHDVNSGAEILIRPNTGITFSVGGMGVEGMIEVVLKNHQAGRERFLIIGTEYGSRFDAGQVSLAGGGNAEANKNAEIYVEVSIDGAAIVIKPSAGDADSFLARLFPEHGIEISTGLKIGISNLRGLYFGGGDALKIYLPIHLDLGPIAIQDAFVAIATDNNEVPLSFGCSISGELGPLAFIVKDVGLRGRLSFASNYRGNIGPINVELGFLSPPGTGLSLNTGPIVGAGFLEIDTENARYAGILGLKAAEIGLTAIGLITTRMPDGSDGFSLLVSIGVVFAPPIIEPNTGLTIMGVGGLIGVNRDMSTEALQAGLRAKALDSILFPDPATVVENASKIISDLRAVFPPAEGRFVIGPMIKAGWGGGMISAEIGVFISLPMPVSVALLGQVQGFFPQPGQNAVVELNMDILGILDIGQKMLSFQASLRDSNILRTFVLYGDTAFLLSWGESPQFALAVGGFHPRFDPPPPPRIFSGLKRLGVSMSVSEAGGQFSIVCEGYHALTPNTLQFGALIDLFAKKAGAKFRGHANFDALIYFSPFSLEAAIAARVSVEYEGVDLANVRLAFVLTGPTPWQARGKAKFEVLHLDVEKSFSFSWGPEKRLVLAAVDPWEKVKGALEQREAWGSAFLPGVEPLESLVSDISAGTNGLLAHPSGTVKVRQRIAPLKKQLAMVGNAPVKDHDWVEVARIELGCLDSNNQFVADSGISVSPEDTFESFARAQFESLSDSQKLSIPSFEQMRGGVAAQISGIRTDGSLEGRALEFESILLTQDPIDLSDETDVRPPSRRWPQRLRGSVAFEGKGEILCAGAGRARQASTGAALARRPASKTRRVQVVEEAFRIVNADDLMAADGVEQPSGGCSRSEADRIIAALDPAKRSSVQVVSAWEGGRRL